MHRIERYLFTFICGMYLSLKFDKNTLFELQNVNIMFLNTFLRV